MGPVVDGERSYGYQFLVTDSQSSIYYIRLVVHSAPSTGVLALAPFHFGNRPFIGYRFQSHQLALRCPRMGNGAIETHTCKSLNAKARGMEIRFAHFRHQNVIEFKLRGVHYPPDTNIVVQYWQVFLNKNLSFSQASVA